MKFHFDITHPAHVHFFKFAMRELEAHGHEIHVTSRPKDVTTDLLDEEGINHRVIGHRTRGKGSLVTELLRRTRELSTVLRDRQPDAIAAVGGIFAAYGGRMAGIPSVIFYATESARIHNVLTFPLARRVVVPECYYGWVPRSLTSRYAGCHELAYLRPEHFTPDRSIALENGVASGAVPTYLLRLVSWSSNHDFGSAGLTDTILADLVAKLEQHGRVLISSERPLPETLESRRYRGNPKQMHHVIAHCRGVVGESSTMVAEGAVLGVPGIYIADQRRGFIEFLRDHFDLVRHVSNLDAAMDSLDWLWSFDASDLGSRRQAMLSQTENVARRIQDEMLACTIERDSKTPRRVNQ